jgi:uncharacterized membrane protein
VRNLVRSITSRHWTEQLLGLSVLSWIVRFSQLVISRQNNFTTYDFDLGIHSQSIWLLAHGKFFNTVCGLPVFGHHAEFMYYLLVPLQWLGGGPNLWNVFQVVALGSGAIVIFKIALHKLDSNFAALIFGLSWLLLPTAGFLAWETFHPEVMGAPFLLLGYFYAITADQEQRGRFQRSSLAMCWLLVAVMWKEDLSLAVIGIGVVLMFRNQRRLGFKLVLGGAVYFLVIGVFLVPTLSGDLSAYGALYGNLGTTPFEVAKNSLMHPSRFLNRLSDNNALSYANQVTAPLAWVSLLSPLTLIIGIPQFFINILTTADFTWSMMYHYQVLPIIAAVLAAIDGVAFLRRHNKLIFQISLVAILCSSVWTARNWGNSPYGEKFNTVPWGSYNPSVVGWKAAMKRIGSDDEVSAHYSLVPHIADREFIYTYPNPWIASNFFNQDRFINPNRIKWIIVPESSLGEQAKELLARLVSSGEFGDVKTVNGISSYRRLK